MNPNLRVEKDLAPSLPPVALDGGPLQAVIGHLLENAIEASQNGGVIRVAARTTELSDAEAKTYLGRPGLGSHLLVTITDSGVGMKPEVRRRVLVEPFFTTKVRHRGLGSGHCLPDPAVRTAEDCRSTRCRLPAPEHRCEWCCRWPPPAPRLLPGPRTVTPFRAAPSARPLYRG